MRYAVLGGGKRLRPLLVYASGITVGEHGEVLDAPACAVELIHAYSLVHDDLPAMDDDDLRRGRPTCHVVFGEAMAILAGDALQALAFELLATPGSGAKGSESLFAGGNAGSSSQPGAKNDSDPGLTHPPKDHSDPGLRLAMLQVLGAACGSAGMAGGQAMDLGAIGSALDLAGLERMHAHKTGALIRAAVRLGALAGGCRDGAVLAALECYAHAVGLAFQVRDDILDVEGETEVIGKTAGKDAAQAKPTFPSILGMDASRRHLADLTDEALAAIAPLGARAALLGELARYAAQRVH